MKDLCTYVRFLDYLKAWPQTTDQMRMTRVLNTALPQGTHPKSVNTSYLKADFFKEFSKKQDGSLGETVQNSDSISDDNFRSSVSD